MPPTCPVLLQGVRAQQQADKNSVSMGFLDWQTINIYTDKYEEKHNSVSKIVSTREAIFQIVREGISNELTQVLRERTWRNSPNFLIDLEFLNSQRHTPDLIFTFSLMLFAFTRAQVLVLNIWIPSGPWQRALSGCVSHPVRLLLSVTSGLALQKSMLCPFFEEHKFQRNVLLFPMPNTHLSLFASSFIHLVIF